MTMTGKELIALLKKYGWTLKRISGSHHCLEKNGQTIIVPVHGNSDLKPGTLQAILRQAGLK